MNKTQLAIIGGFIKLHAKISDTKMHKEYTKTHEEESLRNIRLTPTRS